MFWARLAIRGPASAHCVMAGPTPPHSEVGPNSTRRLRSAGVPFGFGGHAEPLTCFSYSLFSNEGSGACRTNLAAHRRSNLLSRSRGIELIGETPGLSPPVSKALTRWVLQRSISAGHLQTKSSLAAFLDSCRDVRDLGRVPYLVGPETSEAKSAVTSVCRREITDRKLNLTVGKLTPFLNN